MERFVFEFAAIDRVAPLLVRILRDLAHLNVHTGDDAVHFSADVGCHGAVCSLVATAQAEEVRNGPRRQVVEKFKNDSILRILLIELNHGVLARP